MEQALENLREAIDMIIDVFKRCISTIRNTLLEVAAIREKVKEHKDNYKLFRQRYRKTNMLRSQIYNKKYICRCRSNI